MYYNLKQTNKPPFSELQRYIIVYVNYYNNIRYYRNFTCSELVRSVGKYYNL